MAAYDWKSSEEKRQKFREAKQVYAFDIQSDKPVYSIDTPPPTISGNLHIGHIFSYTQAELIARYKRMSGYNVYYPMGYDDNGIPTEILVEKELGLDIKSLDRQDFAEKCLTVNQKYRDIYKALRQRLGVSVDRNQSYATITKEVQRIVQDRFVWLVQQGHVVAQEFPALRCTATQTTIAQAETEEIEMDSFYYYVDFDVVDDGGKVVGTLPIATTRPELMPACVCAVVHPDDERYARFVGQNARTPFGDLVPIISDQLIKQDKGTGAIQCCSFGDAIDMQIIIKNKYTPKIIITKEGYIKDTNIAELDGLSIAQARENMGPILEKTGKLTKKEAIVQSIIFTERGKVPVEILPVHQRFVKILDQKTALKDRNNAMAWYPKFMQKRSDDRIDGLERDWNISRSRKFGIPIPVRYEKSTGTMILASSKQLSSGSIDPSVDLPDGYTRDQVIAEEKVFDTRFTSGLTPEIHQQFLTKKGFQGQIQSFSLRPQAHDIIRTRLLYTTLQSHYKYDQKPFVDIMVSGHVLAGKGEKISKSKGNAVFGPDQLLSEYGADVTRYWCLSGQLGKDMVFEKKTLEAGQKLVMKMRNAMGFVAMQTNTFDKNTQLQDVTLYPTDKWLFSRLHTTIKKMQEYLDRYEYGLAKIVFEDFFRKDFCDNYLEIVKVRLYKPETLTDGITKQLSGQYTLYNVFYAIIAMIAPYMPHITEEIYQSLFVQNMSKESLHQCAYPLVDTSFIDTTLESNFAHIITILSDVRGYKTHMQVSLGASIDSIEIGGDETVRMMIDAVYEDLLGATKAKQIRYNHLKMGTHIELTVDANKGVDNATYNPTQSADALFDRVFTEGDISRDIIACDVRQNRDAVRGIIINEKGEIAIIHLKTDNIVDIPGGGKEGNEFEQQTFAREIQEEVGVKAKIIKKLCKTQDIISQKSFILGNTYFIGSVKSYLDGLTLTEDEQIQGHTIHRYTLDDAIALFNSYLEKIDTIESNFFALVIYRNHWILQTYQDEIRSAIQQIVQK